MLSVSDPIFQWSVLTLLVAASIVFTYIGVKLLDSNSVKEQILTNNNGQ